MPTCFDSSADMEALTPRLDRGLRLVSWPCRLFFRRTYNTPTYFDSLPDRAASSSRQHPKSQNFEDVHGIYIFWKARLHFYKSGWYILTKIKLNFFFRLFSCRSRVHCPGNHFPSPGDRQRETRVRLSAPSTHIVDWRVAIVVGKVEKVSSTHDIHQTLCWCVLKKQNKQIGLAEYDIGIHDIHRIKSCQQTP